NRCLSIRAELFGRRFGAALAERVRLRFAAAFRHRLGEIGEEHGKPEPETDLENKPETAAAAIEYQFQRRDRRPNLGHDHHRVLPEMNRVELLEALSDRRYEDLRIE